MAGERWPWEWSVQEWSRRSERGVDFAAEGTEGGTEDTLTEDAETARGGVAMDMVIGLSWGGRLEAGGTERLGENGYGAAPFPTLCARGEKEMAPYSGSPISHQYRTYFR